MDGQWHHQKSLRSLSQRICFHHRHKLKTTTSTGSKETRTISYPTISKSIDQSAGQETIPLWGWLHWCRQTKEAADILWISSLCLLLRQHSENITARKNSFKYDFRRSVAQLTVRYTEFCVKLFRKYHV